MISRVAVSDGGQDRELVFRVATANFGYARNGWCQEFRASSAAQLRVGIARAWQDAHHWYAAARTSRSPTADLARLELHVETVSPPTSTERSWSHILRSNSAVRHVYDEFAEGWKRWPNDYPRLFSDALATEQHCRNLMGFADSIGDAVEQVQDEQDAERRAEVRAGMRVVRGDK